MAMADHELEAVMVGVLPFEGGDQAVAVFVDDLVGRGEAYSGGLLCLDSLLH